PAAIRRPVRRMPNVEELPITAQNEIKAQSGHAPAQGLAAQKKKVGFLERLANVGRHRKEPDAELPAKLEPEFGHPRLASLPETPKPQPQPQNQSRPRAQAVAPRAIRVERRHGEAAPAVPKPSDAQLNAQVAVVAGAADESSAGDALEIPAFLRRRAN